MAEERWVRAFNERTIVNVRTGVGIAAARDQGRVWTIRFHGLGFVADLAVIDAEDAQEQIEGVFDELAAWIGGGDEVLVFDVAAAMPAEPDPDPEPES